MSGTDLTYIFMFVLILLCSCAEPLELDILLTVPAISNLDDAASQLENDLVAAFGLFQNQTFARNMNYLPSATIEALIWVFPNSGDYLPSSVSENITNSLRHHLIVIQQGAYLLKNSFTAGVLSALISSPVHSLKVVFC